MKSFTLTAPTRSWEGRAELSSSARLLEMITGYWITQLIYVAAKHARVFGEIILRGGDRRRRGSSLF
ncbi:MAG: hypothetical protein L0Z50_25345 [Verrucomicrobiales bacterium]|nr:hypothetical protein [Verrucomicrobiales bacterium]